MTFSSGCDICVSTGRVVRGNVPEGSKGCCRGCMYACMHVCMHTRAYVRAYIHKRVYSVCM
jgi:hypothetical protein